MSADRLKLLYILMERSENPGVLKKFHQQARELSKSFDLHLVFLLPEIDRNGVGVSVQRMIPEAELRYYRLPAFSGILKRLLPKIILGWIRKHFFGRPFQNGFKKLLKEFRPDILYLRYPGATKALSRVLDRSDVPFVLEFNGLHWKTLKRKAGDTHSSKILKRFEEEENYGERILRKADGVVCVGKDILDGLHELAGKEVPGRVIPNGVRLESIPIRKAPKSLEDGLRVLYLAGSLREVDGFDLILDGVEKWKEEGASFSLSVTLSPQAKEWGLVRKRGLQEHVHFIGKHEGKELNALFDQHHIAFGAMAFFRQGTHQKSTLKVLEYLARGIPFMIGYREEHLQPPPESIQDLYREIDLKVEGLPSWEELLAFAKTVCSDPAHPQRMREFAEQRIRMEDRMEELGDLLMEVHERKKG